MTPLLSVIVPVYNTKEYLGKCIDSILAQTYSDYELILVDDGSTDGSSQICDEYAKQNEKIHVIHKGNCGLLHTRKVGFDKACGEYVSYIDSDDYIEPEMYEYMIEKLCKYDADIAICNMMYDENGNKANFPSFSYSGFFDKEKLIKEIYPNMLYSDNSENTAIPPSLCNKIIRKSVLQKALEAADNTISFGEDALCSFPCLLDAESVYICEDKYFYVYRQVPNSMTRAYDEKLLNKFNLLIKLLDNAFSERGFDGKNQLDCYAARASIECLRKELLFDKDKKIRERIRVVREYVSRKGMKEAYDFAAGHNFNLATKIKIFLIRYRCFYILYLLFYFKNLYLKRKG